MDAGQLILAVLGSSALSAIVCKVLDLLAEDRREKKKDTAEEDAEFELMKNGLKSILASDIERRCDKFIAKGRITARDKQRLEADWDLYHNGLKGNGFLDLYMQAVEELEVEL